LSRNWNDATSLIELDISRNQLTSIDNLPFNRMSRLVKLHVTSVFSHVVDFSLTSIQMSSFEGNTSSLSVADACNLTRLEMRQCTRLDSIANFHQLTTLLDLDVCVNVV
jgi:Leucine-rich repeat (LRR) protein